MTTHNEDNLHDAQLLIDCAGDDLLEEIESEPALNASLNDEGTPAPPDPARPRVCNQYRIADRRLLLRKHSLVGDGVQETPVRICEFAAEIDRLYRGEHGDLTYHVSSATSGGRRFEFELGAEDFADDRRLKAAFGRAGGVQAVVHPRMASHVGPAIQMLSAEVGEIRRYTRTGWAGGRFLIPGNAYGGGDTVVELDANAAYRLGNDGDLDRGLAALEALVNAQKPEATTIALAHLFVASAAAVAGWRDERNALFVEGRTGSYKTSWMQSAMTLYGPGFLKDQSLVRWGDGATRNAVMRMATQAADMPFLVDNYKPNSGGGSRDFVALIHAIVEGGEKRRLSRVIDLHQQRSIFAWPVFTGEDVPATDAAGLARVLVVSFPRPVAGSESHLSAAQAAGVDLNAVGAAWIHWLESDDGRRDVQGVATHLNDVRRRWVAFLQRVRPQMSNAVRVATNLAVNELSWMMMAACPALADFAARHQDTHRRGLEHVARQMAAYTTDSTEAARFLEALQALLGGGRVVLLCATDLFPPEDVHRPVIGWHDGEGGAYLIPEVAKSEVERLLQSENGLGGLSAKTLYRQLADCGALASTVAGEHTDRKFLGGAIRRVLHITKEALSVTMSGAGPDPSKEAPERQTSLFDTLREL